MTINNKELKRIKALDYSQKLTKASSEVFDLIVCTSALMRAYDVSTDEFLFKVLNDDLTNTEIVEAVVGELDDLLSSVDLDIIFEPDVILTDIR